MNLNPTSRDPQVPKVELPAGQAVPRLTSNTKLAPTGFWTNLKDFLTERSIRLPNDGHEAFRNEGLDESFWGSLKAFFSSSPRVKGATGADQALAASMEVEWEPGYRVFIRNLRDLISPPKLPPLKLTSKPVAVRSLWAKREKFEMSQAISIGVHVLVVFLLVVPLASKVIKSEQPAQPVTYDITDVSPYLNKLPPAKTRAGGGGGGGGGERMPTPPTRGKVPRFTMTQLAPPMAVPRDPTPTLPVEPTLLGPPDLKVPSPNDPNFGDPLSKFMTGSGGPGSGGGIGTGSGGGIGSGNGGGLGPGSGGGTGGGAFRAGVGGVGTPTCIYCPSPEYSEDARKAKYQGTVVLQVVIQPDGHATDIKVLKGPGLGLDEKAMDAVKTWRFKPAAGPDGKLVATITAIEVNFRLL